MSSEVEKGAEEMAYRRLSRLSIIGFQCVAAPRARVVMITGVVLSVLLTLILFFFFKWIPAFEVLANLLPPYLQGMVELSSQRITAGYGAEAAEFYRDMYVSHLFLGVVTLLWFSWEIWREWKKEGSKKFDDARLVEPENSQIFILLILHLVLFSFVFLTNVMDFSGGAFNSPRLLFYFMLSVSAHFSPYTTMYALVLIIIRRRQT